MSDYTDDEILSGISAALAAHDMPAVASLMCLLAGQAPDKAQVLYDAAVNGTLRVDVPLRVSSAPVVTP